MTLFDVTASAEYHASASAVVRSLSDQVDRRYADRLGLTIGGLEERTDEKLLALGDIIAHLGQVSDELAFLRDRLGDYDHRRRTGRLAPRDEALVIAAAATVHESIAAAVSRSIEQGLEATAPARQDSADGRLISSSTPTTGRRDRPK